MHLGYIYASMKSLFKDFAENPLFLYKEGESRKEYGGKGPIAFFLSAKTIMVGNDLLNFMHFLAVVGFFSPHLMFNR